MTSPTDSSRLAVLSATIYAMERIAKTPPKPGRKMAFGEALLHVNLKFGNALKRLAK